MSTPTEAHLDLSRTIKSAGHPCSSDFRSVAQLANLIADSEAKAVAEVVNALTCTHHNDAMRAACPVCLVAALTAERDQLRAEVERLKTGGIVELAAINSSVLEYCKHWEARAEQAEADLATERARLDWLNDHFDYELMITVFGETIGLASDGGPRELRSAIDAKMQEDRK